jgi:5'-nucleotidase / UDP-sugar diphosphatase
MTRHCTRTLSARAIGPLMTFFIALLCIALSATVALSAEKRFTLLHTTDEHATLLPAPRVDYHPQKSNPAVGGYARLSTLVSRVRTEKADEPVMLFSSGDIIGGTPFSWLILEGYSPEIELMQHIGYDGMTIGNHEFDYGPDVLAEYFLRAGYPGQNGSPGLVAANLEIPLGHRLQEVGLQPHRLYPLPNGIVLGVFGLLGKGAYKVAPAAAPVSVSDLHEAAAAQVAALRAAGADIIIALTHSGIKEDRELAADVAGIDIILGGHDHIVTDPPEAVGGTLILHSGYNLKYVGRLELAWDSDTGQLDLINAANQTPYLMPLDSGVAEDPVVLARIDDYTRKLNAFLADHTEGLVDDVAGHLVHSEFSMRVDRPYSETTVGNFVTDAMRLATEALLGEKVDIAFQANGNIRSDIVPGTMPWSGGMVSFFDLVSVSGLGMGPDDRAGYPMVSIYLTAREVHNILEISSLLSQLMGNRYFLQVSGLRYRYDPGKALWMRIPFLNTPVPAYRSVREVELYTGGGRQDQDQFEPLDTQGEHLYHVVTDYYLTAFLPMVGEKLPRLELVLKDKAGNPVSPEDAIIKHSDREFKVWEAVARYGVSLAPDDKGVGVMPGFYRTTHGRIDTVKGVPLKVWAHLALYAILLGLVFAVYRAAGKIGRKRRRAAGALPNRD